MYHTNSEKIRPDAEATPGPVPWWLQEKQLTLGFEAAPKRVADDPPSEPDRTQPMCCPGTLPEDVQRTYIRVLGLPALHPASDAGAPTRRPVDADARCGEVTV